MKKQLYLTLCIVFIFSFGCASSPKIKGPEYSISGGPAKGSFITFANGISRLAQKNGVNIQSQASSGSRENIYRVNSRKTDFAIAYSPHIYNGRNGLLINDSKKYENIYVLGYLYGAQAQLIFSKNSDIDSAAKLVGKRVGVGPPGTGSFAHCKEFFNELEIWEKIERHAMSDRDAAEALTNGFIDAFWTVSGYPNKAVDKVLKQSSAKLFGLYSEAQSIGYFDKYPYYAKATIPANSYSAISNDTITFQSSTLLIAHRDVPEDVVKELLKVIYSDEGIRRLEKNKDTARFMKDNDGIYGIITPLHLGAIEYYNEVGMK